MSSLPTTPTMNATASARWLAVLGLGVFVLSLFSLELTRLEAGVALVWLSSGLAVGVLLSWPGRIPILAWLTLALALVGARLMAGDGAARIALMSSLNLAEVALVVSAVRRFGRPLAERQNLLRNAAIGALASVLACAVLALLAAVGLGLIGQRALGFVLTALALFSAHLLGMVTTASVVTMAIGQRGRLLGPRGSRGGFALSWLLLVAVLGSVMAQTRYPLLVLAWLAFRHGVGGAVMGVLGVAVMAGGASILRLGPFQLVGPEQPFVQSLLPQVYVLTASLLALPLGLLVAERRRLLKRLRRSEARYRLLAEHTRDLVVRLAADGQRRYVLGAGAPRRCCHAAGASRPAVPRGWPGPRRVPRAPP
jgi:integral membrane sensor domain MASE1